VRQKSISMRLFFAKMGKIHLLVEGCEASITHGGLLAYGIETGIAAGSEIPRWVVFGVTPKMVRERGTRQASMGQLADQREALRAIFDDPKVSSPAAGRQRLRQWLQAAQALGIRALDRFCQTLQRWLDKIANYFRSHASNGRTEGLNHGLRAILWRAYGMANFQNFRLRVLHCFGLSLT
jgi:hypothetical protein